MAKLTEADLTNLRWMVQCNSRRIGYLGPTLRKFGRIPELQPLVDAGYAAIVYPEGRGDRGGYWITDAGRAILEDRDNG